MAIVDSPSIIGDELLTQLVRRGVTLNVDLTDEDTDGCWRYGVHIGVASSGGVGLVLSRAQAEKILKELSASLQGVDRLEREKEEEEKLPKIIVKRRINSRGYADYCAFWLDWRSGQLRGWYYSRLDMDLSSIITRGAGLVVGEATALAFDTTLEAIRKELES